MRTKLVKILFPIVYIVLCISTICSASIYIAGNFNYKSESVAAFAKENSRIELILAIDNVNHSGIQYHIDRDYFKYTKYYDETYCDDLNNPFIINGKNSKVLISDSLNTNYFNVKLKKGSYPDDNSFIVSEEVAQYYSIADKELPVTITIDQLVRGVSKQETITVNGIFDASNNQFTNKPDFKHNEPTNYVMIGKNSNNLSKFGKYTDVIGIFTNDKLTNSFAISLYEQLMGGVADFVGYDNYSTTEENALFTAALQNAKNPNAVNDLVIENDCICIIVFAISIISTLVFGYFLLKNFRIKNSIIFNIYTFTFAAIIISFIILCNVISVVVSNGVIFLLSIQSSVFLVIGIIALFCLILLIDILSDTSKSNSLLKEKYNRFETTKEGLVSIIIPSYNGSKYIDEAIKSAINQTYKNIEIIVVDDGTKDNGKTKAIVDKYPSVKYFYKENGGVSSALNLGISKANGSYINWLSHDDILTDDSVEKRIKFLIGRNLEGKYIVSSRVQYINSNGNKMRRISAPTSDILNVSQMFSKTVNGCSLLIPKCAFDNHKFREGMIYMPDYDMWLQLINDGYHIVHVSSKLVKSRVHKEQITVNRNDLHEKDFEYIYNSYIVTLMNENNVIELKKIVMTLKRREALHPFYKQYIAKISEYLYKNKYFNYWDTLEIKLNSLFSSLVKTARKVTSK